MTLQTSSIQYMMSHRLSSYLHFPKRSSPVWGPFSCSRSLDLVTQPPIAHVRTARSYRNPNGGNYFVIFLHVGGVCGVWGVMCYTVHAFVCVRSCVVTGITITLSYSVLSLPISSSPFLSYFCVHSEQYTQPVALTLLNPTLPEGTEV